MLEKERGYQDKEQESDNETNGQAKAGEVHHVFFFFFWSAFLDFNVIERIGLRKVYARYVALSLSS